MTFDRAVFRGAFSQMGNAPETNAALDAYLADSTAQWSPEMIFALREGYVLGRLTALNKY